MGAPEPVVPQELHKPALHRARASNDPEIRNEISRKGAKLAKTDMTASIHPDCFVRGGTVIST
jgi:hypothetical protein